MVHWTLSASIPLQMSVAFVMAANGKKSVSYIAHQVVKGRSAQI